MHGLINRSIQSFVVDTYGRAPWVDATLLADIGFEEFEALLPYDDQLTLRLLEALAARMEKPAEAIMEDLGTYLVSHENLEPLRRLLRFGGRDFPEFLYSLDDLRDRARLAVPDLDLPRLRLTNLGEGAYTVESFWNVAGFSHVLMGILRAMADDYGDLVFLDHLGGEGGKETIKITLLESAFAQGRSFDLTVRDGGTFDA